MPPGVFDVLIFDKLNQLLYNNAYTVTCYNHDVVHPDLSQINSKFHQKVNFLVFGTRRLISISIVFFMFKLKYNFYFRLWRNYFREISF